MGNASRSRRRSASPTPSTLDCTFERDMHLPKLAEDIEESDSLPILHITLSTGALFDLVYYPSCSIKDLKQMIQCKVEIPEIQQTVQYGGKELRNERTLSECGITANDTLQVSSRGPITIQLFVKSFTGKTVTLEAVSSDTVLDIKKKIEGKIGIPLGEIRLGHAGVQLNDIHLLSDYAFQNGMILNMGFRLKGGGGGFPTFNFSFNISRTIVKRPFTSSAPKWRTVCRGLSFHSTCLKPGCDAYKKAIIVKKGFGTFDIAEASDSLVCPMCAAPARSSTNCGFYMAKWDFTGKKRSGKVETKQGIANTNSYYMFKEGKNEAWRFIRITVERLDVTECAGE